MQILFQRVGERERNRERRRERNREGRKSIVKKMYTVSIIALEYIVTMDALEHEQLF